MAKGGVITLFLVYLLFGLYFINSSFDFINVPEIVLNFDKWITLIGGVLILIGGVNHFRAGKKTY